MAPARGGEARRIASIAFGAPITWSADSRHLTFHARPPALAQAHIVDIDEQGVASPPRRLTNAPYDLFGPVFSPDGKWLYITSFRDPVFRRVVRVPSAGGQLEDLFEGDSQQMSADGRMILYAKPNQRGLWWRSLDGDVSANAETRLVEDYVGPQSYVPGKNGVFYVGRTPDGQPSKIRFFERLAPLVRPCGTATRGWREYLLVRGVTRQPPVAVPDRRSAGAGGDGGRIPPLATLQSLLPSSHFCPTFPFRMCP
jgi:hypothetical protein